MSRSGEPIVVKVVLLSIMTCFMLGLFPYAHAQMSRVEDARISAMTEGNIHVSAPSGNFVLEPLRPCHWCTVGMEVLLTLKGYTTAKLQPKGKGRAVRVRPLRAFILKDGRLEE